MPERAKKIVLHLTSGAIGVALTLAGTFAFFAGERATALADIKRNNTEIIELRTDYQKLAQHLEAELRGHGEALARIEGKLGGTH